jgi:hypothetical protein
MMKSDNSLSKVDALNSFKRIGSLTPHPQSLSPLRGEGSGYGCCQARDDMRRSVALPFAFEMWLPIRQAISIFPFANERFSLSPQRGEGRGEGWSFPTARIRIEAVIHQPDAKI